MTKEEIINEIKCLLSELNNGEDAVSYLTQNDVKWLNENIKALEQEPFINKPCVSSGVCEHDKNKVLDKISKIRDEIRGKYRVILKDTPRDDWAVRWNDCIDEVLQTIDKYKAE